MRDRKNGFPPPKPKSRPKIRGGVFDSAAWNFKIEDPLLVRRAYTQVWGRLTTDPEYYAMANTTCARARIMARNGHVIEVAAYGDTLASAAIRTAKRGDYLFCLGQRKQSKSYKKKLERETWDAEVKPSIVIVAKHLGLLLQLWEIHEKISIGLPRFLFALWNLPEIQEQAKRQSMWDEKPDVWEWDG